MPQIKVIEQVIFYFSHEEVEELLYEKAIYHPRLPTPAGRYSKRITAGLGSGSGLTLTLQREKKGVLDAKG